MDDEIEIMISFYFDILLYENYNDTLEGPLSREAMKMIL